MAVCGRAILQSDGSYLVGIDPSITDLSTCAYVVETGSDFAYASLAGLTPTDSVAIASQIAVLWAVAWGFRQLMHLVVHFPNGESND